MEKVFEVKLAGFPILLLKDRADFEVRYGRQIRGGLSYAKAAQELGEAIMHGLQCEGRLD